MNDMIFFKNCFFFFFWTCVIKTRGNNWSQQWSEAFLELLAGCVNCINMLSLTLKYDNDSVKYEVCMKMRNRHHFSNVNRKILLPILMRLTAVLTSWISSITSKIVPMFPSLYLPQSLCSPVPIFPSPDVPPPYIPQFLYSPVPFPHELALCFPVSVFPSPFASQSLCSPAPLFLSFDIPHKWFPVPIFPKDIPQSLCSPTLFVPQIQSSTELFPVPIFPKDVPQSLYST